MSAINRGFFISAIVSAVLVRDRDLHLPARPHRQARGRRRRATSAWSNDRRRSTRAILAIGAVLIGIVLAAAIQQLTGYFTETNRTPVDDVAKTLAHRPGHRDPLRASRSVWSRRSTPRCSSVQPSTAPTCSAAARCILSLFAIALAGTGLLTTVGVIVSMDTFGPVSDNAQGIAEMSGDVDEEGAQVLTSLDAVGNTTKAITKGIAIATAVLAATALFGSFRDTVVAATQAAITAQATSWCRMPVTRLQYVGVLDVANPRNLVGLLHRCGGRVHVLGPGHQRGLACGRRGDLRGASPVPRAPRDHGRHREAGVRQGRRHRHARLAARAGHAWSARRAHARSPSASVSASARSAPTSPARSPPVR